MAVGVKLSPYVVKSFNFDMYVTCICTHFSPDTPCVPSVLFKTSSNFNLMHAAIKPMASCECRGPSHSLNLFFYYSWSTNENGIEHELLSIHVNLTRNNQLVGPRSLTY